MKKMEFDYYDWNEFKQFLDQLPDKDAAKLIATIQNIENNGLIIAERQLWVANYKFNPNKPGNFQWQSVDDGFLMVVD